jgi:hypothetical protein
MIKKREAKKKTRGAKKRTGGLAKSALLSKILRPLKQDGRNEVVLQKTF